MTANDGPPPGELGWGLCGRKRKAACLPAWNLCQIKEGDLKEADCGCCGGSYCSASRGRVKVRVYVKLGYGIRQRERNGDLCQTKRATCHKLTKYGRASGSLCYCSKGVLGLG